MVTTLRGIALITLMAGATLAADIAGKWDITAQSPAGRSMKLELVLKQDGDKVTGTLGNERGTVDLADAKLDGNDFTFKITVEGVYAVKLALSGDSMKGTSTGSDGTVWQIAAAKPAAAVPAGGITGKWKLNGKRANGGEDNVELELADDGGKLTGAILAEGTKFPIQDVKLDGRELSFRLPTPQGEYTLKLTIGENSMKGTYSSGDSKPGELAATR
ncbi:MAG: hypothetical protein Q8N47_07240 [Bryobacterales bacterium]|nr:hypothetical protein [Bryobacterales bacterium]